MIQAPHVGEALKIRKNSKEKPRNVCVILPIRHSMRLMSPIATGSLFLSSALVPAGSTEVAAPEKSFVSFSEFTRTLAGENRDSLQVMQHRPKSIDNSVITAAQEWGKHGPRQIDQRLQKYGSLSQFREAPVDQILIDTLLHLQLNHETLVTPVRDAGLAARLSDIRKITALHTVEVMFQSGFLTYAELQGVQKETVINFILEGGKLTDSPYEIDIWTQRFNGGIIGILTAMLSAFITVLVQELVPVGVFLLILTSSIILGAVVGAISAPSLSLFKAENGSPLLAGYRMRDKPEHANLLTTAYDIRAQLGQLDTDPKALPKARLLSPGKAPNKG